MIDYSILEKSNMRKYSILTLTLLAFSNLVLAQTEIENQDTLKASVSTGVLLSSQDFSPFYLINNQFGEVDEDAPVFLKGEVYYAQHINSSWTFNSGLSFRNDILSSLFSSISFKDWQFSLGRMKKTYGGLDTELTTGSFGLSRNALPLPMIELSLNEYKSVPFTHDYLKFKGSLSQRWMEEDRYISKALLHGKTFYGMVDLEDLIGLQVSGGIVHFAQYGGISPQGDRPT